MPLDQLAVCNAKQWQQAIRAQCDALSFMEDVLAVLSLFRLTAQDITKAVTASLCVG